MLPPWPFKSFELIQVNHIWEILIFGKHKFLVQTSDVYFIVQISRTFTEELLRKYLHVEATMCTSLSHCYYYISNQ